MDESRHRGARVLLALDLHPEAQGSETQLLAVVQDLLRDPPAVEEGAVGAALVDHRPAGAASLDARMPA
jgi:hypothetical protein